jgi:NAD(P)-dependent dehydrogenase (short-subunit alcohol dehydrogenase family)
MESQKIAIVTGAGSGIGRAAALSLLADGWTVVLAGRRREQLEATADLAGTDRDRALPVVADVSDPASVDALFETVRARFGRLDLLFNNAGASAPGVSLEDLTLEDWRRVVDVNLTGVFLCTQAAFRQMKSQTPQGGRIINNGSIAAYSPRPLTAPYAASKAGVTGLTKAASLDGRAYDIAVGQIDIGNADTDMARGVVRGALQPNGEIAPEPLMDISAVGQAVVYMAGLPLGANVQFMTVMATKMPYIGRG